MEVLVTKVRSLDPDQKGLIPVGYKISGTIVDYLGREISISEIKSKGLQIRVSGSRFSEKPYQFAADSVQIVKEINKDFEVYTVSSVYLLQTI